MDTIKLRKIDYLTGYDFIYSNKLPRHMIYLRDEIEGGLEDSTYTAWQRLKQAHEYRPLIFTDIYRSPASSAEAYKRKTGVAKPGYSGHNYGISVDVAVDATLKKHKISYQTLCEQMIAFGWTPFQGIATTYVRGKEDWHFNFAGDFGYNFKGSTVVDRWINTTIKFDTTVQSVRKMLTKLKFLHGDSDEALTAAIKKFQLAWFPPKLIGTGASGKLDNLTIRMINIVSADVVDENNLLII